MNLNLLTMEIVKTNIEWLTLISVLLDNDLVFLGITLFLVFLGEQRKEKFTKIVFAIVLAFLFGAVLKFILVIERPCVELPSKVPCPSSYSFPSGHGLVALTVMLSFLNKRSFLFYFFYAVFILFTRIYLGVHTFYDIAGSVGFAPLVYYITDELWKEIQRKKYAKKFIKH